MQCTWTFTKRFILSIPQRKCPMLRQQSQKLRFVGSAMLRFRVRDFSVRPIRSGRFGLSRFCLSRFGLSRFDLADWVWPFRSGDILVTRHFGQTMKSCRNLTCSLFNAMQTGLHHQKVLFKKKHKHDPTSNS